MSNLTDPRTGLPVGEVPGKTSDSSGSGEEKFGPTPTEIANAIGAKADAKAAKDTKAILAALARQEKDANRRRA